MQKRWRRVAWFGFGGLGYAVALFTIGQIAFANGFLAGLGLPPSFARSGSYDSKLSEVAAVDPEQMTKAVTEASGGPPTIAPHRPLLPDESAQPSQDGQPSAAASATTSRSAPASSTATQVMPTSIAALIAMIPPPLKAAITGSSQPKG